MVYTAHGLLLTAHYISMEHFSAGSGQKSEDRGQIVD